MRKVGLTGFFTGCIICFPLTAIANSSVDNINSKKSAQPCFGCHGQNGISQIPSYPNLAGQKQKYLEIQLRAYRDGERIHDIMSPMAKSLTNSEIATLAQYFSGL